MKYQIEIDCTNKLLAEKYSTGKTSRWVYDSQITDQCMLLLFESEDDKVEYIHICHPDDFILDQIERDFRKHYLNHFLLKAIRNT